MTAAAWAGRFGSEYLARNRVNWRARIPFWQMVLDKTGARSAYEFGCNAGWNLSALLAADPLVNVSGSDVNEDAVGQAKRAGLSVVRSDRVVGQAELVFTAGVLIHIQPKVIQSTMKSLVAASDDWILAVEYRDSDEVEVEYRGQPGMLWRRDYGKLYQQLGLNLVDEGEAGGFDRCHFWLCRK